MPTRVAVFGALFIVALVLVRAASFHRVDQLIGESFIGLRWNLILEMGGLLVIQAASVWAPVPTRASIVCALICHGLPPKPTRSHLSALLLQMDIFGKTEVIEMPAHCSSRRSCCVGSSPFPEGQKNWS